MSKEKHSNEQDPKKRESTEATISPEVDRDKSFSDREHGRTHNSPKTKVNPKTR